MLFLLWSGAQDLEQAALNFGIIDIELFGFAYLSSHQLPILRQISDLEHMTKLTLIYKLYDLILLTYLITLCVRYLASLTLIEISKNIIRVIRAGVTDPQLVRIRITIVL